jgi:hypothetical protein
MSEFHVGEIAIYVKPGSPVFGKEVTIISPLRLTGVSTVSGETGLPIPRFYGYEVDLPAKYAKGVCVPPEHLRKKQQKRDIDQLVSWDSCPWQPKRQTA